MADRRLVGFWISGVRWTFDKGGWSGIGRLAACAQGAALFAAGEARDLPVHERRTVARRYVRLQTRAGRGRRQNVVAAGPYSRREADGLLLEVHTTRPERSVDFRAASRNRITRRRTVR